MINILGHFFEMSKSDAERAMEIYRTFTRQTDFVVQYLQMARQYEHHTRVEVPKLKHAPVNLGRQLEEYLKDSDFEIHRRQYLAELDAKKKGGVAPSKAAKAEAANTAKAFPEANPNGSSSTPAPPQATKGPDPDLIDFFDSIEQNQTTMAVNPQQQQAAQMDMGNQWASNSPFNMAQATGQFQAGNGFMPQQQTGFANNSPFQQQNFNNQQQQQMAPQIQPSYTGSPFGGYGQQQGFSPGGLSAIPQDSVASFQTGGGLQPMQTGLQPNQQTNPFRASMLVGNATGMSNNAGGFPNAGSPAAATPLQRQSTNPFARPSTSSNASPFASSSANSPFQTPAPQPQAPAPLQPMATGTNPFARNFSPPSASVDQRPQTSGGLMPQPTGSTNPFRQSAFVNHQTGMGWQHGQQPIGGGLDQLPTVPVFPRPAQSTPWQS